jgi:hypothetical protein
MKNRLKFLSTLSNFILIFIVLWVGIAGCDEEQNDGDGEYDTSYIEPGNSTAPDADSNQESNPDSGADTDAEVDANSDPEPGEDTEQGVDAGVDKDSETICAPDDPSSVNGSPLQEVFDKGLTKYAGTPEVKPTTSRPADRYPKIIIHKFDKTGRGPICMRGADFFVETREGKSENLMIFLEGGGVCLDEVCAATATPMLSLRAMAAGDIIGLGGLLDKSDSRNPVADYDVVHVPYCDSSIFLGDVDRELSDGKPRNGKKDMAYQRGLLNLTAALEVAHSTFPCPPRIVLAGTSGGSYGVVLGTALTRYYYPNTPITVIADSGAPVLTDEKPNFVHDILTQLNAIHLIPDSCPDCIARGHATGAIEWAMERDKNFSIAYLGHARDHVIGEYFMDSSADNFEVAVVRETGRLVDRFPDRAYRFVVPGKRHTFIFDAAAVHPILLHTTLALFGPMGLSGGDVTRAELSTWKLGGLAEKGYDTNHKLLSGYEWLRTILEHPERATNVLQLSR